MEIHEQLDQVNNEKSFLEFVQALIKDREADAQSKIGASGRGGMGWENHTIEDFLEAACAWAEATDVGLTQGMDKSNPWKRFASFLYCGKIYE